MSAAPLAKYELVSRPDNTIKSSSTPASMAPPTIKMSLPEKPSHGVKGFLMASDGTLIPAVIWR
jgi:hypothetical protein